MGLPWKANEMCRVLPRLTDRLAHKRTRKEVQVITMPREGGGEGDVEEKRTGLAGAVVVSRARGISAGE